jgi:hypothetical protein
MRDVKWSEELREWWMDTEDETINAFWAECHPDAITVTNAETLPAGFLADLAEEAAYPHALSHCNECGRNLVVTLYPSYMTEFYYCRRGRHLTADRRPR